MRNSDFASLSMTDTQAEQICSAASCFPLTEMIGRSLHFYTSLRQPTCMTAALMSLSAKSVHAATMVA
eukprot:1157296-Pelagomonas_calceolata.AAC.10